MDPRDRWQAQVDRAQAVGRLPSLVAGVVQQGELVWTGSAGVPSSSYRIGSITKTINAVAVLQCRDEGLLSLDDPLGRFVECGYRNATLRALLAHVSGMQSEPVGAWWERSPGVPMDQLLAANDGSGAVWGAGEAFHYSNLGHALLGEVVARVRGSDWWSVISSRVLAPLGMTSTSYLEGTDFAQGFSVHHYAGTLFAEPHADTVAMAPAGQLWSTIGDLALWARFLAVGDSEVLALATLDEMATPVPPSDDYGLGLRLLPYDGRVLRGHTGSMPGFQATLFADRASGDAVIGLTNSTTGFDPTEFAVAMLAQRPAAAVVPWTPTVEVPGWAGELLGVWHWGNSAHAFRWHNGFLESHSLAMCQLSDRFALVDKAIVGIEGYHHGEPLHVVRRRDGSISHLACATYIYTRAPYDPT